MRNSQGLTFLEWFHTATFMHGGTPSSEDRLAWRLGVDPTDYAIGTAS